MLRTDRATFQSPWMELTMSIANSAAAEAFTAAGRSFPGWVEGWTVGITPAPIDD